MNDRFEQYISAMLVTAVTLLVAFVLAIAIISGLAMLKYGTW